MNPPVRRPSAAPAPWLAPALLVASVAVLVGVHLIWTGAVVSEWTYNLATIVPAALAGAAWYLHRHSSRTAWNWIAAGVVCSAVGDAVYLAATHLSAEVVQVSPADLAWLSGYVCFGIGMLGLLRSDGRPRLPDPDVLLDVATVVAIAMPIVWELSLSDTVADTSTAAWIRVVWSIYPVLDAILLALAIRLALTPGVRTPPVGLLIAGVGLWLGSDFGMILTGGTAAATTWLDVGWMLGAGLIGAAAVFGFARPMAIPSPHRTDRTDRTDRTAGAWRLAFSILAMLVPITLQVAAARRGRDMNLLALLGATATLTTLLFIRAFRVLSERRDAERRLRSTGAYYRALAANSSDAVMVVDRFGQVINDSANLGELVGSPLESAVGESMLDLVWLADPDTARQAFATSVATPGEMLELEVRLVDDAGQERWLGARLVNLLDDPAVGGVVVNLHDITDRKRAEESLEHQAFHDALTGLANRSLFQNRVEHAVELGARTGRPPAVLYLDLDDFKRVNDTLGHAVGDRLLRQVASRLELVVRDSDTVSRLGGDEFAILVEQGGVDARRAIATAERVLDALGVPIQLGADTVTVAASIGIAAAEPGTEPAELLRDADNAMYHAKAGGRGRYELYTPAMREIALERLRIEADLPAALDQGQFRLVYQPIVRLDSSAVSGFEALLRWDHPVHGPIPPDRFIPVCEENGMILPIGEWVLRTACETAARWARTARPATISVNLSAVQLCSDTLVPLVREVLDESGIDAGSLVLEVTETALVDDADAAAAHLLALRALGVRLAVDDFGTGYSSLEYLRLFPVDILKIDGSFVQSIQDRDTVPAIVPGLLGLGRTLGLQVVAEGIENEVQRRWLRSEGCEYGQGYLFSAPMSADEAAALLQGGEVDATV